jgi:copper(I)-binding protein
MLIIPFMVLFVACGNQPSAPVSPTTASTAAQTVGSLQISDVWARSAQVMAMDAPTATTMAMDATKPTDATMAMEMSSAVSGAYLTIKNTGSTPDKLLKAQGDVAASVELHTMTETNGVMEMRPVDSIEIPANGEVQLKPGGFHVMLIGLKKDLKAGDTVPLTLQFEKAGTIQVVATVRDAK